MKLLIGVIVVLLMAFGTLITTGQGVAASVFAMPFIVVGGAGLALILVIRTW